MAEGQNQVRKSIQDARLEIRELLTPDQRKQFDELVKRPFRKPIFGTNTPAGADNDLKIRLEKMIAAQRSDTDQTPPPLATSTNAP